MLELNARAPEQTSVLRKRRVLAHARERMAEAAIPRDVAWRAIRELRMAEALLDMGTVSGPADAPPEPGQEQSWIADWLAKSRALLKRAAELVTSGHRAVQERGVEAARRVHASARRVARFVGKPAEEVKDAAARVGVFWSLTSLGMLALAGYILLKFFK